MSDTQQRPSHAADCTGHARVSMGITTVQTHLSNDGSREDGGGGGAVTSGVVGAGSRLADKLGANVLHRVLKIHLAGHGHAVVHNSGGAVLGLKHNVASLGLGKGRGHQGSTVSEAAADMIRAVGM